MSNGEDEVSGGRQARFCETFVLREPGFGVHEEPQKTLRRLLSLQSGRIIPAEAARTEERA
jgi:hypothetical protein